MYEFYQLGQAWNRLLVQQSEPWLNSPLVNWYMDLFVESMLDQWFWMGAVVEAQDQMEQFKLLCLGNLCQPR